MNSLISFGVRSFASRFVNSTAPLTIGLTRTIHKPASYSRTLWHMCSVDSNNSFLKPQPIGELCRCGCSGLLHTKGESDLVQFLKQEIVAEQKAQKLKSLPASLEGFTLETDGAEMTLTKKNKVGDKIAETIIVNFNVSHTVDTEESDEIQQDGSYTGEMKSKPSFEVDIVKENSTLRFGCSFTDFKGEEADSLDNFQIDEVTYFEGEWDEKVYAVSGDVLDAYLYDLFIQVLEEKGVSNEFVDKLSELATSHEHSQYIRFLEKLNKFVSTN